MSAAIDKEAAAWVAWSSVQVGSVVIPAARVEVLACARCRDAARIVKVFKVDDDKRFFCATCGDWVLL